MQILSIGRKKRIQAIAFAPNGQALAAACGDDQLRVWDLATGQIRHSLPITRTSCGYDLTYLDERRLLFAGTDLRCWDLAADSWNVIAPGMPWGRQVCLSPDHRYLAEVDQTVSADRSDEGVVVYETAEWTRLPRLSDPEDTTGGVAFSSDGKWLATGHVVRVGERMRHVRSFPIGYPVPEYDYVVHIRAFPSGQTVHSISGWQQGVSHLAFAPGVAVLVGTAGPRLRIWDIAGEREIALHKRGTKHFQGLSFTADGQYLATVSNDETVRVWHTQSWHEHTTFTWGIGKLLNIAFAPDGFRAAAGSDSGQIIIWDIDD
jgi:WD40 repeat protein